MSQGKIHVDKFLEYLKFQKRYSQHTIVSYKNDIIQFRDYVAMTYGNLTIIDSGHIHIRSWMVQLIEVKITPRSINRKLSALRSFFNYLKKQGIVDKNPTLKIISPKVGKKLPEFVNEKNIEQLFDTILTDDFKDYRNRLIIEIMYTTGIRRIELINIKEKDIDRSSRTLKVLGKGNKERIIPISPLVIEKVDKYKELRDLYFEDSDFDKEPLFISDKGNKLYPKWLYNMVKRYLSSVTTIKKRSPHTLRHSFATHLMNGGADLNAVKELLGHANLAATQVYTHNSIEKLKKAYKQAHPKSKTNY